MEFYRRNGELIGEWETALDLAESKANLLEADLRWTDLQRADLRGADLREADLRWTDLRRTDLWGANLRGADLREADLRGAGLREANLREVNLRRADLRRTDLQRADLQRADLREADLREADLREAKGIQALTWTDHGYLILAIQQTDGDWRIQAGCRDFTIEQALSHWGALDYHTPSSGERVVLMIKWLQAQLAKE